MTTIADQLPHPPTGSGASLTGRAEPGADLRHHILATGQGPVHLYAVRDGCSRRVIGYAFSDSLHTDRGWDNAQQESFWSTWKTEFYHRYSFATHAEAIPAVSSWIGPVYNRRRRHSALGQIHPVAFEHRITTAASEAANRCLSDGVNPS